MNCGLSKSLGVCMHDISRRVFVRALPLAGIALSSAARAQSASQSLTLFKKVRIFDGKIQRAIAAGVKCIEHGHLMDEATASLIADKGIWLSTQAFPDEMADAFPVGSHERAKALEVFAGTDNTFNLAKKFKIKTAFGTDILFSARLAQRQTELLAKLVRWYSPAETLAMATGTNAQLLALSGKRNPYPGKLGVLEQGALADLLLVDGDPLANIKLIEDPGKNFVVIMKDGKIYKNTLDPSMALTGN